MDIAAYSVQSSLANVQAQASMAVLRKSFETSDMEAQGIAKLMEGAAQTIQDPALGNHVNLKI